jgi:hypothetical protein
MKATKLSVRPVHPSRSTTGPLTLLLRVVPSGERWSWRLLSRAGTSGRPRLIYADSTSFPTAEEAAEAGRAAVALADFSVSGPIAA